jgi:hypothetical protein
LPRTVIVSNTTAMTVMTAAKTIVAPVRERGAKPADATDGATEAPAGIPW